MSTAARPSYYVRRERDGRHGWIGPIRSAAQADKERAAWIDCGWSAEVVRSTPEIRKAVNTWLRRPPGTAGRLTGPT